MKFNAAWFYEEYKTALRTLDIAWGEQHLMTVETSEEEGSISFIGNGRRLTVFV